MLIVLLAAMLLTGCTAFQRPITVKLTPDELSIPAGKYFQASFAVPAGAKGFVMGRITAEGGSGNDIGIYIVTQDGLTNLRNGHQFQAFFSRQKTTVADLNVGPLPPGNYDLVLDNHFSFISSKTVLSTAAERIER